MSILIFGANGMLGHKLYQTLTPFYKTFGTIRRSFADVARFSVFTDNSIIENIDVTDAASLRKAVDTAKPRVVINAVGLIKQLAEARVVESALLVNSIVPHRLAELAAENDFKLITISTDCVFDGTRGGYADSDPPDARDLYGISKSLGEISDGNALTLRTSIVGRELGSRNSIVEWFLANRGGRVDGYAKALYSGLTTIEFARVVHRLIADHPDVSGVYNLSADQISKFKLLRILDDAFDAKVEIIPSDEVVIDRTLDSTKFRKLINYTPPTWESMIAEIAADPTPYDEF